VIATNVTAEEELKKEAKNQFILEDNKEEGEEKVESFLVEEDDEQLLMGAGSVEGTNIAKLEEGEDHGTLVNKIIENTRELEKEHMQDDTFLVDDSTDQHEMRRIRAEIEAAQKGLQTATQYVQPFVRILEFVLDDFDTMLRDLEECRKQSAVLERKLDEQLASAGSQNELDAALHKLDTETRSTREQIARATATIVRNERKMAELLAIDSLSNSN
jgi:predicted transcriptional regulator